MNDKTIDLLLDLGSYFRSLGAGQIPNAKQLVVASDFYYQRIYDLLNEEEGLGINVKKRFNHLFKEK